MPSFTRSLCIVALLASGSAEAADFGSDVVDRAGEPDVVIELGVGGQIAPRYEGARDYKGSPFPIISLDYLNIPGLISFGSIDPQRGGFSIGPSFDYVDKRKSNRHDEIRGLSDVDPTYQAGLQIGYEWNFAEVYADLRYAFGGADGFVGDLGANLVARPFQELQLKVGPTLGFASGEYMNTYFGISPAESVATGGRLDAFDPDSGFNSAGIAASARYEFRPTWFLNGQASWNRYIGDAADSPVVKAGNEDQYMFGLGISKRFSLDLF